VIFFARVSSVGAARPVNVLNTSVAGLGERRADHFPAREIRAGPHIHLQDEHIARSLEAIGLDVEHPEITVIRGNGDWKMMLSEYALVSRNEAASGGVFDLTTS
jgi:hypothetical protein